jgi:hypothetical protein
VDQGNSTQILYQWRIGMSNQGESMAAAMPFALAWRHPQEEVVRPARKMLKYQFKYSNAR